MPAVPHDADKRGYLLEEYRLFHLKETRARRFSYHYHEFDKVVVFLSGQVTYTVEGRAYFLSPGDLLLVPHHHDGAAGIFFQLTRARQKSEARQSAARRVGGRQRRTALLRQRRRDV